MSKASDVSKRLLSIRIGGTMALEPRYFFEDSDVNVHEDATAQECARQIANYVEDHGLARFLLDWNLDDIDVSVDDVEAVVKGGRASGMSAEDKPHLVARASNLDPEVGARLAGFVDGEGCFHIRRARKPRTGTVTYSCSFHLGLRMDDRVALETWQRLTAIGAIYDSAHRFGNSKPLSMWVVHSKAECLDVVRIFQEFPLWTKKVRDFTIWAKAVRYWNGPMPEGWVPMEQWFHEIRDVRGYDGPTRESFDVVTAASLFDLEEDDLGT